MRIRLDLDDEEDFIEIELDENDLQSITQYHGVATSLPLVLTGGRVVSVFVRKADD
jgi:hypothetical protein